ncbi:hypothetical protein BT63DRAFT_413060 [Microthyrium microscopicum]|uniref:Uncharacterized protein n=1 Tax=Microthyrium microscopicum TaxID=703497 RepID=A0A6A6UFJ1_9PEZI|nr:hypothetical protein BT63DRAFT_413060 [Microthyrium microscopicum]
MASMDANDEETALSAARIVRERETYRYLNVADIHAYVDTLQQTFPAARPCNDTSLAAFAQLALMRLSAQRAFISLLDRTYCYTVGEATAWSKLRPPSEIKETELVMCGIATRHAFSLPSLLLETAVQSLLSVREADLIPLPVLAVQDLREDDRFCSVPFPTVPENAIFCAAVPILSHDGSYIGVLGVLDSQPRTALTQVDKESLQDMSRTIMNHLNLVRTRREYDRSSRMVRGLGSFVERQSTMSGLVEHAQSTVKRDGQSREGSLNKLQQVAMLKKESIESSEKATVSSHDGTSPSLPTSAKNLREAAQPPSRPGPFVRQVSQSSVDTWHSIEDHLQDPESPIDHPAEEVDHDAGAAPATAAKAPPPVDDLQQLFSRAANIIRESIEVEGVLFFDASVGYWGGAVDPGKRDTSRGGSRDGSEGTSSTSTASTTSSSGSEDQSLPTRSTIHTNIDETTCDVFGFSMTDGSSIDGKKPSAGHLTVPERFLRILLRRYPMGKIFNFNAEGEFVTDGETDTDEGSHVSATATIKPRLRRKHSTYSRVNEAALIISIFPGARSVLAFPLWDSHRERWFAGGVCWTRTPTRVFSSKGELSYLRAFGMVTMAEVARMDADNANKSRTTLLSSISHELRSPLHGILGGVEILHGTEIDVFQANVVHTVETCGIMLLDTIEHLLTASQINQSVRVAKLRRREQRKLPRPPSFKKEAKSGIPLIEIDTVTEEVIESIFAGYEFLQSKTVPSGSQAENIELPSMAPGGMPSKQDASPSPHQQNVKIILEIDPSIRNWTFGLDAGALRRIVMNLFGNALKYTTVGHIKVSVTQRELSKRKPNNISEIKIVIQDTGKGIGREYLANHLFKPFSQEDTLNQGTGLGLSITHQIVASLNGKIEVSSTVGKGTTMGVLLHLTREPITKETKTSSLYFDRLQRTKGLRVSLFGFQEHDAISGEAETLQLDNDWQLPRASIYTLCQDSLQMDVLAATDTDTQPAIYIATQAGAQELASMNEAGIFVQPCIVICPTAGVAHDLTKRAKTSNKYGIFEYISQPCSPHKVAKTITLCLDRWTDIQAQQAIKDGLPVPNPEARVGARSVSPFLDHPATPKPHVSGKVPAQTQAPFDHQLQNPEPGTLSKPTEPDSKSNLESEKPSASTSLKTPPEVAPFLLVDDNDVNLKLLSTYLSRKGYPVIIATDGQFAIEAYQAGRGNFSCIFMDIQMPRLDGIAATRAIREFERQEHLPAVTIVALTGLVTEEKQREAEASGVNEFFSKPVRLKALDVILQREAKPSRKEVPLRADGVESELVKDKSGA